MQEESIDDVNDLSMVDRNIIILNAAKDIFKLDNENSWSKLKKHISSIIDIISEPIDIEAKMSKFSKIEINNLKEVVVAAYIFFIDESIGKS